MSQARHSWVLDNEHLSELEAGEETRRLLRAIAPFVDSWECDVPLAVIEGEPAQVRHAAEVLAAVDARRRKASYAATGVVTGASGPVWDAFVAFAPLVYDASLWDGRRGAPFVKVADSNASISLDLTAEQHEAVAAALTRTRLVKPAPRRRWWRRRCTGPSD